MNKLVILDRDGVINFDSKDYIKSTDEWQPIPGSLEAIATLNSKGFKVAVATNQSGLGRGYFDKNTLNLIHKKMLNAIHEKNGNICKVEYCPHHPDDNCSCRKPKPGMILTILSDLNITDTSQVIFIGDSLRDVQAACLANCKPILVRTGNGQKTEMKIKDDKSLANVLVYNDLFSFAQAI